MILKFRQRFFSWYDSYDIYDEAGDTYFTVEGKLGWGHKFVILDKNKRELGRVEEQLFRFLPHFTIIENRQEVGEIVKKFTWFKPSFTLNCNNWRIDGDWLSWEYKIVDEANNEIASITKEIFHLTDTYLINVKEEKNCLRALMVVLAIDAAKCSQND